MLNIDELKVGDRVGVSGAWDETCEIRTVIKRTATQAILDDGSRWMRSGRKVGEGFGYRRAFLMTEREANERNEEARKKRERRDLVRSVEAIKFGNVTDDGLRMILQLAKDHSF